jgi:hypothetical protein
LRPARGGGAEEEEEEEEEEEAEPEEEEEEAAAEPFPAPTIAVKRPSTLSRDAGALTMSANTSCGGAWGRENGGE